MTCLSSAEEAIYIGVSVIALPKKKKKICVTNQTFVGLTRGSYLHVTWKWHIHLVRTGCVESIPSPV